MDTTAAGAADEPTEAMEQVEGEERVETQAEVGEAETHAEVEEAEAEEAEADESTEAMEQVEGEERTEVHAEVEETETLAEVEEEETQAAVEEAEMEEAEVEEVETQGEVEEAEALQLALPVGRVKKIIRVDRDIRKVSGEAYMLITAATELFLGSLATGAHTDAAQRGRRTVSAAHVWAASRAHRPTADFLLDCLPDAAEAPPARGAAAPSRNEAKGAKPLPRGTRRIEAFFQKVT